MSQSAPGGGWPETVAPARFCPARHRQFFSPEILHFPAISAIISFVERDSLLVESWLSGLRRTTGNRVYVNSVPRVQIPNSPPRHPAGLETIQPDVFLSLRYTSSFGSDGSLSNVEVRKKREKDSGAKGVKSELQAAEAVERSGLLRKLS